MYLAMFWSNRMIYFLFRKIKRDTLQFSTVDEIQSYADLYNFKVLQQSNSLQLDFMWQNTDNGITGKGNSNSNNQIVINLNKLSATGLLCYTPWFEKILSLFSRFSCLLLPLWFLRGKFVQMLIQLRIF